MSRRGPALLPLAALAALACSTTTELADWPPDAGDTELPDVIAMDCSGCEGVGGGVDNLACAFDLCDPTYVLESEYVQVTTYRDTGADPPCGVDDTRAAIPRFGDAGNDLDPRLNGSYAVMATGDWDAEIHTTTCSPDLESDGTDLAYDEYKENAAQEDKMYDAVEWRLRLQAPDDAKSFSFSYVFFSAEYDEFIAWLSNDKFYVVLEAPSTDGGAPTVINYTVCRDEEEYYDFECTPGMAAEQACSVGAKYCYIAINSAMSECCWWDGCPGSGGDNTAIAGTGYECAADQPADGPEHGSSTGWLRTIWPIDGGEELTLTFHIHDTADTTRDSAVILDAFQFHRSFTSGNTIPE